MGKSVNCEQPKIKLHAIESVLTVGQSEGVFQIRYPFVEAVIMRIFTDGIRQLQCSHS